MFAFIRQLFRDCFRLRPTVDDCDKEGAGGAQEPVVKVSVTSKPKPAPHGCIPPAFQKQYAKVVPHGVTANEAVCLTSDVAVLGDASVTGDTCITGNILVAGVCTAKGSICITGDVIILGNAHAEGDVCVTGNAFIQGDLAVKGKLDVGGKLCVWGSKDIQPRV